jgi:flavin-dependent dehydrogenase
MSQSCRHVKVAVIGSGLAGLTAAWLLSRQVKGVNGEQVEIECHLFEKVSAKNYCDHWIAEVCP